MNLLSVFILLLTIIPAASYGWGMRGTTIGGEKGAMLPGALIGALLAINSDILIVRENFFIFAALGAIGMYFGGCMTYGETLGLSMSARPAVNMKKGLQGVFLKGFLWFGVFGAVFSTGINAICKIYHPILLVCLFVISPIFALLLMIKLNRPYNVDEYKFPNHYFSKKRREYWGAMLGILISFLLFNIISLNVFGLAFPIICALFGGIGWVLGQLLQIYSIHYAKYSKNKILRTVFSNKNIDSWKLMECVLGAFGGLGSAIAFITTYKYFKKTVFVLESKNLLIESNNNFHIIILIVWLMLIALDMLQYFIKKPITKELLRKQLNENIISKSEFITKSVFAVDKIPKYYEIYRKSLEPTEFILYAAIPFILISLGNINASIITAIFILFLVMAQEIVFENQYIKKNMILLHILFFLFVIGILIFVILNNIVNLNRVSFRLTLIIYTIIYEIMSISLSIYKNYIVEREKGLSRLDSLKSFIKCKTTIIYNIYYIVCFIILYCIYL